MYRKINKGVRIEYDEEKGIINEETKEVIISLDKIIKNDDEDDIDDGDNDDEEDEKDEKDIEEKKIKDEEEDKKEEIKDGENNFQEKNCEDIDTRDKLDE